MIVYHYLTAESALKALRDRRLKLSHFNEIDDLLELSLSELSDLEFKNNLETFKKQVSERYGMVCFSAIYHDPALWSHYADGHRGVALVFNIPDNKAITIQYQPELLTKKIDAIIQRGHFEEADLSDLISTQFSSRRYEQEVRMICDLNDHFCQIDAKGKKAYFESLSLESFGKDAMKLVGLIRGARCELNPIDIAGELLAADTLCVQDTKLDPAQFQIISHNTYSLNGVRSFSACCFRV